MAFSTNGTSGGDGLSSEINMTPLIDVLLVMLIIFMVIVPVMPRGLESALPSGASAGPAEEASDRPVLVQVNPGPDGGAVHRRRREHEQHWGGGAVAGATIAEVRAASAG